MQRKARRCKINLEKIQTAPSGNRSFDFVFISWLLLHLYIQLYLSKLEFPSLMFILVMLNIFSLFTFVLFVAVSSFVASV